MNASKWKQLMAIWHRLHFAKKLFLPIWLILPKRLQHPVLTALEKVARNAALFDNAVLRFCATLSTIKRRIGASLADKTVEAKGEGSSLGNIGKPDPSLPDYCVWGVLDWDSGFQRSQQICLSLAQRGYRVFFIESSFEDALLPGMTTRTAQQHENILLIRVRAHRLNSICNTSASDYAIHQISDALHGAFASMQARGLVHILEHPFWAKIAFKCPHSLFLYDMMDCQSSHADSKRIFKKKTALALRGADLALASSQHLLDEATECTSRAALIENVEEETESAKRNSWEPFVDQLLSEVDALKKSEPLISIVILSWNNLGLTQKCLSSIELFSDYPSLEIIVVDNGSIDGSREWLESWVTQESSSGHLRKTILNNENRGYPAGCNQGARIAQGEYLTLLNNDTYVTRSWVRDLRRHLDQHPSFGIVAPATNKINGDCKIDMAYKTLSGMEAEAFDYTWLHAGQFLPLKMLPFFCVMMRMEDWRKIGELDEAYGLGSYEDDDYCMRMGRAGKLVACVDDVFVHHTCRASNKLLGKRLLKETLQKNREIFERRWGPWVPREPRRKKSAYGFDDNLAQCLAALGEVRSCCICGSGEGFLPTVGRWGESLICQACGSTSRHRSIAHGLLRSFCNIGKGAFYRSLREFALANKNLTLRLLDTQKESPSSSPYPIPGILVGNESVDLTILNSDTGLLLGEMDEESRQNERPKRAAFPDSHFDIVIANNKLKHARLPYKELSEIYRILKPGGVHVFTESLRYTEYQTVNRVDVVDEFDPSKDVHLLEPAFRENSCSSKQKLIYTDFGTDLIDRITAMGFKVFYTRQPYTAWGIRDTELFCCRKEAASKP
ncbi:MAG: glycosyltransferase [Candidatus Eutrophobiaceae bacterium]